MAMDVLKPDRSKAGPPDRPEYFSGLVRLHNLRRPEAPGTAELIGVFFDRGARTIPHIHEADQVLYFVEGEGIVATERERRVLRGQTGRAHARTPRTAASRHPTPAFHT